MSGNEERSLALRDEKPSDHQEIAALLQDAFGGSQEAALVEGLRGNDELIAALVAEKDDSLAGFISFAKSRVESDRQDDIAVAWLVPLAVKSKWQHCGIGQALTRQGLERCRAMGYEWAVVLGDPDYYGRFGFSAKYAEHLISRWPSEYLQAVNIGSHTEIPTGRLIEPLSFAIFEDAQTS